MISPLANLAIRGIQFFRARRPSSRRGVCIYRPTCGDYGVLAISRFGVVIGGWLTLRRLLRCDGSRFEGGDDAVPTRPVSWPNRNTRLSGGR